MSSPRRPAKNGQRAGSILIFCLAIVWGLFAVARRLWVSVAAGGVPHEWDIPLLEWMESHRTPFATTVAWVFSSVGDTLGMSILSLCVIGLFFWRSHSLWPGALIALTAAGSVTLTVVLKNVWGRARPPLDDALLPIPASYSFPSGHTLNSVAILGVIGYLAFLILRSQWARIVALSSLGCLAVGVGWSRIYLGHHWLTDVIGGLLIGGCWAAVVIIMHHFVMVKNRRTIGWLRL